MVKAGVIGVGSWGIASSLLLRNNGHGVMAWSVLRDEIVELRETREHRTPSGVHPSEIVIFTDSLEEAMADKDLLVLAVPPIYTRITAASTKPFCRGGQILANVAKGTEESTLMMLSE